jgi:alpha-aminoadipate carrier protein LysW
MANCPACDEDVEFGVNPLDVEEGDIVSCPQCGATLSVIGVSPLEYELIDEDDDLDEDDDEDDEDEDEDDWDEDEDEDDDLVDDED